MKKTFPVLLSAIILFACNQSKQAAPAATPAPAATDSGFAEGNDPNRFKQQLDRGVGFLASGNEPFWSLEINFDAGLSFKTPDGYEIAASVPKAVKAMDANEVRYVATTEKGTVTVQIQKTECINDMSGEKLDYQVTVDTKQEADREAKTFKGCGRYLSDYRINDIWALETVNGKAISKEDFKNNIPRLEINLKEQQVFGNGGCNEFSGTANVRGKKIAFGPFRSTEMACPSLQFESKLFEALGNKTVAYAITPGKLLIDAGPGNVFGFKKVD